MIQKDVIDAILNAIQKKEKIISIELSPGSGITNIIQEFVRIMNNSEKRSLILVDRIDVLNHYKKTFDNSGINYGLSLSNKNFRNITILTQNNFSKNIQHEQLSIIDYIILDNLDYNFLHKYNHAFLEQNVTIIDFLSLIRLNGASEHNQEKPTYSNIKSIPKYTESDAKTYLTNLFVHNGFSLYNEISLLSLEASYYQPDLVLRKDDNIIMIEVKLYRSLKVSDNLLRLAVEQLVRYKESISNDQRYLSTKYCLITFCQVDDLSKAFFLKEYGIYILDVGNLQYLSQDNTELVLTLMQIIPYSIEDIPHSEPNELFINTKNIKSKVMEATEEDKIDEYINEIQQCPAGRELISRKNKAAIQYENLCVSVLNYLFAPEFSQESKQHNTSDDFFRMDYLCALKGTTAFWRFLIQHFNTKFVVFEFKNYSKYLSQNNIYITEKYLFDAALRNVAIIISRNGFNKSAEKAALGCLKEHKKLFIDIKDSDLIEMLENKREGKDPSDYLLTKLERYLMSISK